MKSTHAFSDMNKESTKSSMAGILNPKPLNLNCQGLLGLAAFLGSRNAGVPLAVLVKRFGWGMWAAALAGPISYYIFFKLYF